MLQACLSAPFGSGISFAAEPALSAARGDRRPVVKPRDVSLGVSLENMKNWFRATAVHWALVAMNNSKRRVKTKRMRRRCHAGYIRMTSLPSC